MKTTHFNNIILILVTALGIGLLSCVLFPSSAHAQSFESVPRFESMPESGGSFELQFPQTVHSQSSRIFLSENNTAVAIVQGPTPSTRTVSGVILAEGRSFHDGTTVTIHPMGMEGSDTIAATESIITGLFVLNQLTNVPDGFYVLRFQRNGYLQHRELIALTNGTDLLGVNAGTVLAGDLNGDNRIDREDVVLMGIQYGNIGDWVSDFTGNGIVNEADFRLLDRNFGTIGE